MKETRFATHIALGALLAIGPLSQETAVAALYVFGDSLSDSGNVSIASGGANPGPDYFGGRYSNGPVWVERLATDHLGIAAPAPVMAGGTNHAWAGAFSSGGANVPSASDQVNSFIGAGGRFVPEDTIAMWAGANDALLGGVTDPSIPVGHLVDAIGILIGADARTILVPNLPDLGDTPAVVAMGGAAPAGMSAFSAGFNSLLAAELAGLQLANPTISLVSVDTYGLGKDILNDPGAFSFSNVTDPALLTGNIANADEFIYWDGVHPTGAMHELIAVRAAQALGVPEPSALMLLLIGVAGVMLPRRRGAARGRLRG